MFLSRRCCLFNPISFHPPPSTCRIHIPFDETRLNNRQNASSSHFFPDILVTAIHSSFSTNLGPVESRLLNIVNWSSVHIFIGLNQQSLPGDDEFLLFLTLFSDNKLPIAKMASFPSRRPNFMVERAFLLSLVVFVDTNWVKTWCELTFHFSMCEMATRASAIGSVSAERHRNRRAVAFTWSARMNEESGR